MTSKKKTASRKVKKSPQTLFSDLEILEELQRDILKRLKISECEPKVADLLRVLDSKAKLKLPERGKQKFWELIDQIRKEELGGDENDNEK